MPSLKSFFRRLLGHAGLRLIRTNHPSARYLDHFPTTPLDFLILRLFPEVHGLRFLQIGAHDGRRNDPLYRWICALDWSGCLVEPMPDYAARLRELHADRPQIEVLECAIAGHTGTTQLYRIDPCFKDVPDWTAGVATLDFARAIEAAQALGLPQSAIVTQPVRTLTAADLLRHLPSPGPAIIAIDAEGCDILLATALLEAGCRPRLLHFEHACASEADRLTFLRRLLQSGYEIATFGPDTTAFLPA